MTEDRFSKYFQLVFNLFFTVVGFLIALVLIMLGLKYAFRLLDYIPWFVYMYVLFILSVPAALFISVFVIYFKRTYSHTSAVVKGISFSIFTIAIILWAAAYILDMIYFIKKGSRQVSDYYSYNYILLISSIVVIFFIGVMQALSAEKEKDWMEKRRERGEDD